MRTVIPALVAASLLAGPGVVRAQDSCDPSRAQPLEGHEALVFFLGGNPDSHVSMHIEVHSTTLAGGRSSGTVHVSDGTSTTIMVSEGLQRLSCGDHNFDGTAGVTELALIMRDVRTGIEVPVLVVPADGEIDSGLEQVSIVIGSRTFVDTIRVLGSLSTLTRGIAPPLLSYRFAVTADNCQVDLGTWSKVSGLQVTWDVAEYGSRRAFQQGTVTMSRAVGTESELVKDWLAQFALQPTTVGITMIDAFGEPVARWTLTGVFPVKWTLAGPGGASKVAIETLVLAHEGIVMERSTSGC